VLNNDDLAELLESTRDRVAHMGGDTPSAQGVAKVLEGLIAMLRNRAPADYASSASRESQESDFSAATEPEYQPADDSPPAPRKRIPNRFRTAQTEPTEKKENPLLRPQYADFFNKLIESHKTEKPPTHHEESEDEPPPAREPARHRAASQSSVKPQYSEFFDKLVGKQKAASAASGNSEPTADPQSAPHPEPTRKPEPTQAAEQVSKVPESVWNHTPAPFRDETATG